MPTTRSKDPLPGIEKAPTGIEGFDAITLGGVPRRGATLIVGASGTGKTVFALQSLVNGVRRWREPGIFVPFEEGPQALMKNAEAFGWDLAALHPKRLFFLDARLTPDSIRAGKFDLSALLASLGAKARQIKARRIVFDGVDILLSLLDDEVAERDEIFRLLHWIEESGLTALITCKAEGPENAIPIRYPFLPFMMNSIIHLRRQMADRVSSRHVRIVKYRGSPHAENEFPFLIGAHGPEIAAFELEEARQPVFKERVSTGAERLDHMLGGGFFRGSSTLISGAPGTAKTTLAGAFIDAACRRGERALFVSFGEAGDEIVRNLASVGIRLAPHIKKGALAIYAMRAESRGADAHLLAMKDLLDKHNPTAMVVDPLSAIAKAGGKSVASNVSQRLMRLAKTRGITLVCTSLLVSDSPMDEATSLEISTVADTWIHLSYLILNAERNRALTIVKSRGVGHSNQVRELLLGASGITLTDVYAAGGTVLMGTARWEKEARDKAARETAQEDRIRRARELHRSAGELAARIQGLEEQRRALLDDLSLLRDESKSREQAEEETREALRDRRGGDDRMKGKRTEK